jgi:hypothetical protein
VKQFNYTGHENIENLDDNKENIVIKNNNITVVPSFPYVNKLHTPKNIRIPDEMLEEIVYLIREKTNDNICYC